MLCAARARQGINSSSRKIDGFVTIKKVNFEFLSIQFNSNVSKSSMKAATKKVLFSAIHNLPFITTYDTFTPHNSSVVVFVGSHGELEGLNTFENKKTVPCKSFLTSPAKQRTHFCSDVESIVHIYCGGGVLKKVQSKITIRCADIVPTVL